MMRSAHALDSEYGDRAQNGGDQRGVEDGAVAQRDGQGTAYERRNDSGQGRADAQKPRSRAAVAGFGSTATINAWSTEM